MKEFFIQNRDTILSLLLGIFAFLWGVIQFFKSQKQGLQIEKLRTQLELEKSQKLLNDEKFRKGYEGFIDLLFKELHKDKKLNDLEKGMVGFMKTSLLFAGPETIKTFGLYRKDANSSDTKNSVLYMENLINSMRTDLGVSNDGLKQYDILQTFIVGNAKEEIEKIGGSDKQ